MPWDELKPRNFPAFSKDLGYDLNDGSIFNYIMDSQNLWPRERAHAQ
jgi:hypothetical protein